MRDIKAGASGSACGCASTAGAAATTRADLVGGRAGWAARMTAISIAAAAARAATDGVILTTHDQPSRGPRVAAWLSADTSLNARDIVSPRQPPAVRYRP